MVTSSPPAPEALAAELASSSEPRLALLTGTSGSGKTSYCLALREACGVAGWRVAGIVSPAVYAHGRKIAIDVMDAAQGQRRRLAVIPPAGRPGTLGLGWLFHEEAFLWGDSLIHPAPVCDLLLMDELGPLEFQGVGGFRHAFEAVEARRYGLALVVVRPSLVAAALERWPWTFAVFTRSRS